MILVLFLFSSSFYIKTHEKQIIEEWDHFKSDVNFQNLQLKKFTEEMKHNLQVFITDRYGWMKNQTNQCLNTIEERLENGFESFFNDDENHEYLSNYHIKLSKLPIFIYLICSIVCLSLSSIYHLFYVHSCQVSCILVQLDYMGISFVTIGSFICPFYYYFYYEQKFMFFYITSNSLIVFSLFFFSFTEFFNSPSGRWLRGFCMLILMAAIMPPFIHLKFFPNYIEGHIANLTLSRWLYGALCYLFSIIIYLKQFPERYWPGKFCIWGCSHQIWHIFVFAAMMFHFFASVDAYHDRLSNMNVNAI